MDAPDRSIIAYIAGCLISGATTWVMRDHDRRRSVQFESSFERGSVKVYSHELHSHVSGLGAEGKYTLFHHATGSSVDLLINVEERTFSGWDHRTSHHFFGNVVDRTVRLYDYQDLQWHLYTL